MLKTRILSACVFVPLILIATILGGWFFAVLMLFVAIVGGYELQRILAAREIRFQFPLFCGFTVLLFLCSLLSEYYESMSLIILFLLFALLAILFVFGKLRAVDAGLSFFGSVYIGLTLSTMVVMRVQMEQGIFLIFLVFIIQWLTDTGAYFVGSSLGRHKLMPKVSPKKSVEGAVGGVVVAVISALIFNAFTHILPWGWLILVTVCASALGQMGDLVESAFKRWAGVKDSGKIIPGHGGILDRFDSLLFIAPFLCYFLMIYTNLIQ